eukprot:Opistho-1_new@60075
MRDLFAGRGVARRALTALVVDIPLSLPIDKHGTAGAARLRLPRTIGFASAFFVNVFVFGNLDPCLARASDAFARQANVIRRCVAPRGHLFICKSGSGHARVRRRSRNRLRTRTRGSHGRARHGGHGMHLRAATARRRHDAALLRSHSSSRTCSSTRPFLRVAFAVVWVELPAAGTHGHLARSPLHSRAPLGRLRRAAVAITVTVIAVSTTVSTAVATAVSVLVRHGRVDVRRVVVDGSGIGCVRDRRADIAHCLLRSSWRSVSSGRLRHARTRARGKDVACGRGCRGRVLFARARRRNVRDFALGRRTCGPQAREVVGDGRRNGGDGRYRHALGRLCDVLTPRSEGTDGLSARDIRLLPLEIAFAVVRVELPAARAHRHLTLPMYSALI